MPTANTNEFRLDGMPSDPTLVRGLLAETADPVWMIAVQMALGEMQAVDGGSPAAAALTTQASPLTRWLPRLPDGSAGACLGGLAQVAAPAERPRRWRRSSKTSASRAPRTSRPHGSRR